MFFIVGFLVFAGIYQVNGDEELKGRMVGSHPALLISQAILIV
jgi:hypothetical protein